MINNELKQEIVTDLSDDHSEIDNHKSESNNRFAKKFVFNKRTILFVSIGLLLIVLVCLLTYILTNYSFSGVAAQVNSTNIMEDDVTNSIQNIRKDQNLLNDQDWKNYLKDTVGYTPEEVRSKIIDYKVEEETIKQIAKEKGINIDESYIVNKQLDFIKQTFTTSEELNEFTKGLSDDELKDEILKYCYFFAVKNKLINDAELNESQINEFISSNGDKFNGSKAYYKMVFDKDDRKIAESVLNEITTGNITFEDATKLYSLYTNDNSYLLYDGLSSDSEKDSQVLAGMSKGEVSPIFDIEDSCCLLKYVDSISCENPLKTLSNLPEDTQINIKNYIKNELYASEIYENEYKKYYDSYDVKIYKMPPGLSYA